jgi:hypothetical protein
LEKILRGVNNNPRRNKGRKKEEGKGKKEEKKRRNKAGGRAYGKHKFHTSGVKHSSTAFTIFLSSSTPPFFEGGSTLLILKWSGDKPSMGLFSTATATTRGLWGCGILRRSLERARNFRSSEMET